MKPFCVLLLLLTTTKFFAQNKKELQFLVGTYTDTNSEGIYWYKTDNQFSNFEKITSTFIKNPSYLTLSSDEKFLFSVSENDQHDSELFSFSLNKKYKKIRPISQKNTQGGAPCFVMYNAENKIVITANYTGGNISVFGANPDGDLSEIRQKIDFSENSHLHCLVSSPDKKQVIATDLGTDMLYVFEWKNGVLQQDENKSIKLTSGTGPRHLIFSPNGKYLYVLGEFSRKINVFRYKNNKLSEIQQVETDGSIDVKGGADIRISPDGKYLYASNRLKNDGIAIFSIQKSGKLNKIDYQITKKHPRNFVISPDGKYLLVASRDEDAIQVFEIQHDGLLQLKNELNIPKPVCIQFLK